VLDHESSGCERLLIRTDGDPVTVRRNVLAIAPLRTSVNATLLVLDVQHCPLEHFERNKHSGKVPLVIDSRMPHQSISPANQ
jgi:phenylacetate-CoA ligase